MPNPAALEKAMARHRDALTLYDQPIKLDSVEGRGHHTAPHWEQKLVEGGLKSAFTTSLVIRKADWPTFEKPADFERKQVQLMVGQTWARFRIADDGITDVHISGEWKLQLEALV